MWAMIPRGSGELCAQLWQVQQVKDSREVCDNCAQWTVGWVMILPFSDFFVVVTSVFSDQSAISLITTERNGQNYETKTRAH